MPSSYKPRVPSSMKEAQTLLVDACGGPSKAAVLCRVGKAALHRYTDPDGDHEIVHMPLDIVRALEAHCGEPHVTSFLAHELGFQLTKLNASSAGEIAAKVANAAQQTAEYFAEVAADLADGKIEPDEAARIIKESGEAMDAIQSVADHVRPIRDGEVEG